MTKRALHQINHKKFNYFNEKEEQITDQKTLLGMCKEEQKVIIKKKK